MDNIKIIKLPSERWEEYKKIRLEALKNEPVAFAASFEEKTSKPDQYWQDQLAKFNIAEEDSVLFAEINGELVGMAGWYRNNSEKLKHTATINSIYVKPEYRRKGIASELINEVISELSVKEEIIRLDLNVNTQNERAVKLYQKLGFEIVGTLHKEVFVDEIYYDEYEMEKFIR
jgi:ribosomal protein S18 acetylase RimI-like enzyme